MTDEKRPVPEQTAKPKTPLIVALALGAAAMIPVYLFGFPGGADLDNHFRFALPLYEEIGRGNFFPGWLAESNFGYGDPRFRFYPPFLYYLLDLFRFLTGDWYRASVGVFTVFSIAGAVGVFSWTRRSLDDRTALLAAGLYAFAPYRLAQFYQASLLAEFAAAALLPFALLFVEKLTTEKPKNLSATLFSVGGLAAAYSLIVTTHLPTTVIGSLVLGIFALLLTDWKNNKKALFFCAAAISLGLVASSWFWIRMIGELGWIQAGEKVGSAYYDYRSNFVFSPFSAANTNVWFGSLAAALTVGVFLPAIVVGRRLFARNFFEPALTKYFAGPPGIVRRRLIAVFAVALFSLLMTTDLSRPVWAIVPKLKDIQFPYRWLSVAALAICPLTALALPVWRDRLREKTFRALHLLPLLAFFAALFFSIQDLAFDSNFISRENFLRKIEAARGGRSFSDWLPRGAKELTELTPLDGPAAAGSRRVTVKSWDTHRRVVLVEAGPETDLRLRTYFYPLWRAFVVTGAARAPLAVAPAADGTLVVTIPHEAAEIEVLFVEPPRTGISLLAAAAGWLLIGGFLIFYPLGSKIRKTGLAKD